MSPTMTLTGESSIKSCSIDLDLADAKLQTPARCTFYRLSTKHFLPTRVQWGQWVQICLAIVGEEIGMSTVLEDEIEVGVQLMLNDSAGHGQKQHHSNSQQHRRHPQDQPLRQCHHHQLHQPYPYQQKQLHSITTSPYHPSSRQAHQPRPYSGQQKAASIPAVAPSPAAQGHYQIEIRAPRSEESAWFGTPPLARPGVHRSGVGAVDFRLVQSSLPSVQWQQQQHSPQQHHQQQQQQQQQQQFMPPTSSTTFQAFRLKIYAKSAPRGVKVLPLILGPIYALPDPPQPPVKPRSPKTFAKAASANTFPASANTRADITTSTSSSARAAASLTETYSQVTSPHSVSAGLYVSSILMAGSPKEYRAMDLPQAPWIGKEAVPDLCGPSSCLSPSISTVDVSSSSFSMIRPGQLDNLILLQEIKESHMEVHRIWDCALVLSRVFLSRVVDRLLQLEDQPALASQPPKLQLQPVLAGHRILDLSAGTGILGLYLAGLAHVEAEAFLTKRQQSRYQSLERGQVVMSDRKNALPLIQSNLDCNPLLSRSKHVEVRVLELDWGLKTAGRFAQHVDKSFASTPGRVLENRPFSMIFVSDCLYSPLCFEDFLDTIATLSTPGVTRVFLGHKRRALSPEEERTILRKIGERFEVEEVECRGVGGDGIDDDQEEWVGQLSVLLLQLMLKQT